MSRLVRQVQGVPARRPLARLRGWFICGTALPWVHPKHHDWVEPEPVRPTDYPLLVCQQCDRRMGF